jgi:hypothetical protein
MRFLKDEFFSILFGALFENNVKVKVKGDQDWRVMGSGYGFVVLLTSLGVMSWVGGKNSLNYGWLGVLVFVLMVGVPLFVRFKYFEEIPKNMSREQFHDWQKIKQWTKPDPIYLPRYWVGVIGFCVGVVGLCIAFNNYWGCVAIPGIIVLSVFAYIAKEVYENRKKNPMSEIEGRNISARIESDMEAREGVNWLRKHWLISWLLFGLIGFTFGWWWVFVWIGGAVGIVVLMIRANRRMKMYFEH